MTQETKNRIHRIYGIILSLAAVAAGICLMVSVYQLYQTGLATDTQPYTAQTIAAAFSKIAIPVYLCLVLAAGGIILDVVFPREKKKTTPGKNLDLILQKLQAKTDLAKCEEGLRTAIAREEKLRKTHSFLCGFLLGLTSVFALIYSCNAANWDGTDINGSMLKAFLLTGGLMLIPMAFGIFSFFACRKSKERQIDLMRQATATSPAPAKAPEVKNRNKWILIARYTVLAVAIVILVYGAVTGGYNDVLGKANRICTECIGLG